MRELMKFEGGYLCEPLRFGNGYFCEPYSPVYLGDLECSGDAYLWEPANKVQSVLFRSLPPPPHPT